MTTQNHALESKVLMGQATEDEMGELGLDRVVALKSDHERLQFRDFAPPADMEVKRVGERRYRYVFSSEAPDRVGDVLKVSGWDLKDFRRNPVALWSHDGRSRPPIGLAHDLSKAEGRDGSRVLEGDIELAPEGTSEFVDELHRFVDAGILRATSVGVRILKTQPVEDPEERDALGLGRYGVLSTKHALMEISLVSVPMHQDALRRSVDEMLTKGLVSKAGADDILSAALLPEEYEETTKALGLLRDYVRVEWVPEVAKILGERQAKEEAEAPDSSDGDDAEPAVETKDDPLLAEVLAALERIEQRDKEQEATMRELLARVSSLAEKQTSSEQAEGHADDSGDASDKADGSDADGELAQAAAVSVLLAGLSADVETRLKGRIKRRNEPGEG